MLSAMLLCFGLFHFKLRFLKFHLLAAEQISHFGVIIGLKVGNGHLVSTARAKDGTASFLATTWINIGVKRISRLRHDFRVLVLSRKLNIIRIGNWWFVPRITKVRVPVIFLSLSTLGLLGSNNLLLSLV